MRLLGLAACVVGFLASDTAEAGRRHRRQCCEPVCCEPVCCEPVCVSECAPACCGSTCETVTVYDSCGRIVCRRPVCCETIVASQIIVPAASCCGVASTASAEGGSVAKTPAKESLAATTTSVVK